MVSDSSVSEVANDETFNLPETVATPMRPALSSIRRPKYTGDQRCWPCTVVNTVFLMLVCGVLAFARRRLAALCVGVVGTGVILLRGYLVPYTPRFAPQLVDRFSDASYHTDNPVKVGSLAGDTTGDEILHALVATEVLVANGDEFRLDEGFRERWRAEMTPLRTVELDTLATIVAEYTPATVDTRVVNTTGMFTTDDNQWIALTGESESIMQETWLSIPIAIAEVAAVRALSADLSVEKRITAARPLRMFLEQCPACGGSVEESTDACCGGYGSTGPADILVCEGCDQRLFTFPQDA